MVKLFCALVGEKGDSFSIKIDDSESVDDLKKAIRKEKERTITCDARELQLFLGKASDDTWLDSSSEDVKRLKEGGKTDLIEALILEAKELQGEFGLEEVLEDMPVPSTEQIHVLVVVPEVHQARRPSLIQAKEDFLSIQQQKTAARGSLNILPFSDGVNPSGTNFDRQAILTRMFNWITGEEGRNIFLLLNSPTASGKTSLLLLFQHLYQSKNLVIHHISMYMPGDPCQYLTKFGLDFSKQTCEYQDVIYLLDDAQSKYDESLFWSGLIKASPIYFGPGVRFIIAANHVIDFEKQSSPPDFRLLETLQRKDLLLNTEQSMALLNSDVPLGLQVSLQKYDDLKRTIVEHCNGLIGALCKTVAFYGEQVRHNVPSQVECLHLFYSKKFLDHVDHCFGIVANSQLQPESNDILLKCVLGENINAHTNARIKEVLLSFVKAGVLVSDDFSFKFSSPLAKRYFINRCFTNRSSSSPPDLYQLVKQTIESMSATALKLSVSSSADFPKETTFQHLFMVGLLSNTMCNTEICSELSRSFQTGTHVKGEIDFCVNGGHMWGIELVCSGVSCVKIGEHLSRFAVPMGKYCSLGAKDYVVVDFHRATTNVHADSHQASVSFNTNSKGETCFKVARLKYGCRDPENLTLQP